MVDRAGDEPYRGGAFPGLRAVSTTDERPSTSAVEILPKTPWVGEQRLDRNPPVGAGWGRPGLGTLDTEGSGGRAMRTFVVSVTIATLVMKEASAFDALLDAIKRLLPHAHIAARWTGREDHDFAELVFTVRADSALDASHWLWYQRPSLLRDAGVRHDEAVIVSLAIRDTRVPVDETLPPVETSRWSR